MDASICLRDRTLFRRFRFVLGVAIFVALSANVSYAEPVTIVSQALTTPNDTSVGATASRRVLQKFLQENPDIRVKPFVMPTIQGAAQDSAPLMGIASGQPPHAIYVNFRQSSSYIDHGFLEPLEVLLARVRNSNPRVRETDSAGQWLADPTETEIAAALKLLQERVIGRIWPVAYREASVHKPGVPEGKHVWTLPTATLVGAMLYRRDVFMEAGLNPDEPPQTWDELLHCARKINALPGKSGIMFTSDVPIAWCVYSFMVSNGVRYMDMDTDGEWHATFYTPAAAESIYYLLQLVQGSYELDGRTYTGAGLIVGSAEGNMRWKNGEIGIQLSSIQDELLTNINPAQVGLAPPPIPPGGEPSGELNATMLGVFAGSSPQQKLAVMRYLWFITSDEARKIRVRVMVDLGYGQFVNPMLLEEYGYNDILRTVPKRWREVFERAVTFGVPEPYGKNTQFIYDKVSEPINWAFQNADDLLKKPKSDAMAAIQTQLNEAAARVEKYTLGQFSEEEWSRRRWVGGIALVVIILLFVLSLTVVWRAFTRAEHVFGKRPKLRRFLSAYMMLAPALAIVILWQYGPVIMGLPLALFDYELVAESQFVGIDNFATVLFDSQFWASLGRTFYYVLLVVGLGFWPPILVAILLDEVPTTGAKYTFRTIFYLPAIVSGVIMVFMWVQLYQPNEDGFLNQILMSVNALGAVGGTIVKLILLAMWLGLLGLLLSLTVHLRELSLPVRATLGAFALALVAVTLCPLIRAYLGPTQLERETLILEGIDPAMRMGWAGVAHKLAGLWGPFNVKPLGWHRDPGLAMVCVVIPGIWATSGPGCIIYLAALKTVPEELVEAATIDGATILQKLCYITLPRIKFLILIQLIGAIVGAFKGGTDFILAMTGGGPQTATGGATQVLGMDIFERTFMELQYGIGAAMALLLGGLVIGLTAYQLKRISRAEFRTADTISQGTE